MLLYVTLFAVCYLYRPKISTCFAPDSSITTWRTPDVLAQNCAMETLHLIESRVIEIHVFNANVCYIPTVYKQTASFYRITTCVCNIDRMVDIGKQRHKKNSVPPALVCVAGQTRWTLVCRSTVVSENPFRYLITSNASRQMRRYRRSLQNQRSSYVTWRIVWI